MPIWYVNTATDYTIFSFKACKKRPTVKFMDYADTAQASFVDAGGKWLNWSNFIRKLLNIFLCASQISSNVSIIYNLLWLLNNKCFQIHSLFHIKIFVSFQAVYALFIAQNIQPVSLLFLWNFANIIMLYQKEKHANSLLKFFFRLSFIMAETQLLH